MAWEGNTFFLRLMRQHGTEGGIPNTFDAAHRRVELIVDNNTTFPINLNTNVVETKSGCYRSTSNRNKDNVRLKLPKVRKAKKGLESQYRLLASSTCGLYFDSNLAAFIFFCRNYLSVELELEPLLLENLLELLPGMEL
jgi:hypothetical protein